MAVLLDLMQRYPDKFIPGTDYVASFGIHDDFPGYEPIDGSARSPAHVIEGAGDRPDPLAAPHAKSYDRYGYDRGGCHKTEMTHAEQALAPVFCTCALAMLPACWHSHAA